MRLQHFKRFWNLSNNLRHDMLLVEFLEFSDCLGY